MADAAGLVIGAIALASLFSTCIELFDVFELGRNYVYDYRLACTKIALLRARLSRWGLALNIEVPGLELSVLREHWPEEQDIVGRSLLGIKDIFDDTSLLVERYRLSPKRTRRLTSKPAFLGTSIFHETPPAPSISPKPNRFLLRKRTRWAIHDKGKFDDLINDLSFLIENLEKVTDRLQMPSQRTVPCMADPSATQQPSATTLENFLRSHQISQSFPESALTIQGWFDHVSNQLNGSQATNVGLQKVVMTTTANILEGATQDNMGTSIGLQGGFGDTTSHLKQPKQTNSNRAFGIQGSASPEAIAIVQAQADLVAGASKKTTTRRDTGSGASDPDSNYDYSSAENTFKAADVGVLMKTMKRRDTGSGASDQTSKSDYSIVDNNSEASAASK